jgi:predicted MFS family arabinose efflux permease
MNVSSTAMTSGERRAVVTLASLFSLRMIGLFMIMPVFALFGRELSGSTPQLIGLAIGIYAWAQCVLQIPLGLLADRMDRKRLIVQGLVLFVIGGVVAALSTTIWGVILGRFIQGAGAISGVVMALLADLTREEQRTKAMAAIGMSIGVSFGAAFVIGPWLTGHFGLHGLFWATAVFGLGGIAVCLWLVPTPTLSIRHTPSSYWRQLADSVKHPELLRLNWGIFSLHVVLTACFQLVPLLLVQNGGLAAADHGWVYLPVLFGSFVSAVPAIIIAEKQRKMKGVFLFAIAVLALGLVSLAAFHLTLAGIVTGMSIFFVGFNLLEALLPSLVSKISPAGGKGAAMGLYSSSQFFGAGLGGVCGGWLLQHHLDPTIYFAILAAAILVWLMVAATMAPPPFLNSVLMNFGRIVDSEAPGLAQRLRAVTGVEDVVVLAEEGVAYLKVDKLKLDQAALAAFPATTVAA